MPEKIENDAIMRDPFSLESAKNLEEPKYSSFSSKKKAAQVSYKVDMAQPAPRETGCAMGDSNESVN